MSSSTSPPNQIFIGTFIHPTSLNELTYLHDTAIFVEGATGKIAAIEPDLTRKDEVLTSLGWDPATTLLTDTTAPSMSGKRFFFPGLIDTHIHASQYPNAGIFGKSTLLDWLNTYTFPLESSLALDLPKARRIYTRVVHKTLSHGTTTAAYFATIDVAATAALADICLAAGQRALVGRVCMDEPATCPAWYRDESAAASVAKTREVVEYVRGRDPGGGAGAARGHAAVRAELFRRGDAWARGAGGRGGGLCGADAC